METKDRNRIYKGVLSAFDKIQSSHDGRHLSFGLCTYFMTGGLTYNINNFPEIVKHKPKECNGKYGGYWFSPNDENAIKLRREILIQAIKETETEEILSENTMDKEEINNIKDENVQSKIESLQKEFNEKLEALKKECFQPIFKAGSWVKYISEKDRWINHQTNVFRVNRIAVGTQNSANGLSFLYPCADAWNTEGVANHESKYFRPATEDEIEYHLVTESTIRGYEQGVKLRYPWYKPDTKHSPNFFGITKYYSNEDKFEFHNVIVYNDGAWAEIAEEERIMIDKYEVKITHQFPIKVTIDGYDFPKEFWESAKIISEHSKAKVMVGCSKQFDLSLDVINKTLSKL